MKDTWPAVYEALPLFTSPGTCPRVLLLQVRLWLSNVLTDLSRCEDTEVHCGVYSLKVAQLTGVGLQRDAHQFVVFNPLGLASS